MGRGGLARPSATERGLVPQSKGPQQKGEGRKGRGRGPAAVWCTLSGPVPAAPHRSPAGRPHAVGGRAGGGGSHAHKQQQPRSLAPGINGMPTGGGCQRPASDSDSMPGCLPRGAGRVRAAREAMPAGRANPEPGLVSQVETASPQVLACPRRLQAFQPPSHTNVQEIHPYK